MATSSFEDSSRLAERIDPMGRRELIAVLREMDCRFEIDFTDEFLNAISLDQLRHIILGASLHEDPSRTPAR